MKDGNRNLFVKINKEGRVQALEVVHDVDDWDSKLISACLIAQSVEKALTLNLQTTLCQF